MPKNLVLISIILTAAAACSNFKTVTKESALETAIRCFENEGYVARNYEIKITESNRRHEWLVFFESKAVRTPGGVHVVAISKKTGKGSFEKGQ